MVLRVRPFASEHGEPTWIALSARKLPDDAEGVRWTGIQVSVWSETGATLRQRALVPLADPGGDGWTEMLLYVRDLDGDGVPEVAVMTVFDGADWTPSSLDVFDWRS